MLGGPTAEAPRRCKPLGMASSATGAQQRKEGKVNCPATLAPLEAEHMQRTTAHGESSLTFILGLEKKNC